MRELKFEKASELISRKAGIRRYVETIEMFFQIYEEIVLVT